VPGSADDEVDPAPDAPGPAHPWRHDRVLWGVLAAAVVVRLLWARVLPLTKMGDSPSYLVLAHRLANLHLSGYDGARTPGYPLVLALVGSNLTWLGLLQGAFGVAATAVVYVVIRRATGNRAAAAGGALVSTVSMSPLMYERAVLTECVAAFLLVLLVLCLQELCDDGLSDRRWGRWSLGVGLVTAYLAMTRPSLVAILPALVLFLVLRRPALRRLGKGRRRKVWVAFLLPTIVVYAGWIGFNAESTGWATITTYQGVSLTNATCGTTIVPPDPRDRPIDKIYIPVRNVYSRVDHGNCAGAVTPAFALIKLQTGWSNITLERRLTERAFRLMRRRPASFARQVGTRLGAEWRGTVPSEPYLFRKPLTGPTYRNYRLVQVVLARVVYYGFLGVALVGLVLALARRRRPDPLLASVIAATLLVSVANVLAEGDDVPRFLEPFHPVLVLVVVIAVTRAVQGWQRHGRDVPTGQAADALPVA